MQLLKIYLADDHAMFRKALANLIQLRLIRCDIKEAADGRELLMLTEKDIPDVAIVDLEMPVMNGFKTIERLNDRYPEVKIIALTLYDQLDDVRRALDLGAHGFLSKSMAPEELIRAIEKIASGYYYSNRLMELALENHSNLFAAAKHSVAKFQLSEREYAIVDLICKECTNRQIGYKLSLSENTIRNHKVRIMRKAGVKNNSGLVKLAIENSFFVRNKMRL